MNNKLIEIKNLSFNYTDNGFEIKNISLNILKNDFISLTGKNGSGKSTLVKLICGLYKNYLGNIYINNIELNSYKRKDISKIISYLPQSNSFLNLNLLVKDLLFMGRYAYKKFSDFTYNDEDIKVINESIKITGIENLYYKYLTELSGGEKQKVLLTLSLVQLNVLEDLNNKILIIDEPLTYLDLNFQYEIFSVLSKLNNRKRLTIIIVTHNIDLAIKYTNKSMILDDGKLVSFGNISDVLNEVNLKQFFSVNSTIIEYSGEKHLLHLK